MTIWPERLLSVAITYAGYFRLDTYGTGEVYLYWFSKTGVTIGKCNGRLVAAFLNNKMLVQAMETYNQCWLKWNYSY